MKDPLVIVIALSATFCLATLVLFVTRNRAVGRTSPAEPASEEALDLGSVLNQVFWVAFGLRVTVGTLLLLTGGMNYLAPDALGYIDLGDLTAQHWGEGAPEILSRLRGGPRNFVILNAVVYSVLGRAPFFVMLLSAAAGAWTATLSGRIADQLAGPWAGRRVAWIVATFPSLILWSSMVLRDPLTILAVTGAVWSTLQLRDKPSLSMGFALTGWLTLAGLMRGYLFLLLGVGVAAGFLTRGRHGFIRTAAGGGVAIAAVAMLAFGAGLGSDYYEYAEVGKLAELRSGMAFRADSAFLENIDTSTAPGAAAFLPIGLAYFILAPFPWELSGLRQWLTLPEVLYWYWLLTRCWTGVRTIARRESGALWVLATVLGTICLSYALVSGNLGTAYRHRAQVIPIILVVAGIGWEFGRREQRKLTPKRA